MNQEIRRVAGLSGSSDEVAVLEGQTSEDFLTGLYSSFTYLLNPINLTSRYLVLKKKHSKTGEESRYQGTLLGKPAEDRPIPIEGGLVQSIQAWEASWQEKNQAQKTPPIHDASSTAMSSASSPLSDI